MLEQTGIRGTLVPIGQRRHRLLLNGEMRRAVGIEVGDSPSLILWRDQTSRAPLIPDDVRAALSESRVLEAFLA